MDLLTERQTRLLSFVDACNTSGYRPTAEEVGLWLESPRPRGRMTAMHRNLAAAMIQGFAGVASMLGEVEPGSGEDDVTHAQRLLWLGSDDRLVLTQLGRALLRASERTRTDETGVDVLELGRDDPLAYPRLVARLATAGRALLVDPYLRLEQLHDLVTGTDVRRVLISKQQKGSKAIRAGIAAYLGGLIPPPPVQVRASADTDVHDRVLVGDDGAVHLLGTSLNAIKLGSASTVLVRLPDAPAIAQRERAEAWWRNAEPIQPAGPPVTAGDTTAADDQA